MVSVLVTNIPMGVTEDDLQLHFQRKKFGGGEIDNIIFPFLGQPGQACIGFLDTKIGDTLLQHHHSFEGTSVTVKVFSTTLPVVRVIGIPKGVNRDDVEMHFQSRKNGGGEIKNIVYPKAGDKSQVLITFMTEEVVSSVLKHKPHSLNGTKVTVFREEQVFNKCNCELNEAFLSGLGPRKVDIVKQVAIECQVQIKEVNKEGYGSRLPKYVCSGNFFQIKEFYAKLEQRHRGLQHEQERTQKVGSPPVQKRAVTQVGNDGSSQVKPHVQHLYMEKHIHGYITKFHSEDIADIEHQYNVKIRAEKMTKNQVEVVIRGQNAKIAKSAREIYEDISQDVVVEPIRMDSDAQTLITKYRSIFSTVAAYSDDSETILLIGKKLAVAKVKSKLREMGFYATTASSESTRNPLKTRPSAGKGQTLRPLQDKEVRPGSTPDFENKRNRVPNQPPASATITSPHFKSMDILSNESLRAVTHQDVTILIYTGDITCENSDAIVNAANTQLDHGGGVALAIANAAGQSLIDACDQHIRDHGRVQVSGVMYTGAGNLPSKWVVHAVGPMGGEDGCFQKLTKTFLNTMFLAEKLPATSISIPAISSGIFGVHVEDVAEALFQATITFSFNSEKLREIRLVNINPGTTNAIKDVFLKHYSNQ